MTSMKMMIRLLKIWMREAIRIGILSHLSSASLSLLAPPLFARKRISPTHILRIGATSCTLLRVREEAAKVAALCFSPKAEKVAPKERAKAKERAKESLERTKAIAKAKDRRGRILVA